MGIKNPYYNPTCKRPPDSPMREICRCVECVEWRKQMKIKENKNETNNSWE